MKALARFECVPPCLVFHCHLINVNPLYAGETYKQVLLQMVNVGAQWLSGRVLDSRPRGSGFKPHRRHCLVVLEQEH